MRDTHIFLSAERSFYYDHFLRALPILKPVCGRTNCPENRDRGSGHLLAPPTVKSDSCPSARIFAPRFLQTPPRGDALALRYPSPPSGWDGTFTPQLPNMHGVQAKARSVH